MRFVTALLFLLMLLAVIQANDAIALSLEEAEQIFVDNNLAIKSKRIELLKSDAGILEAKALPNPTLNSFRESLTNGERENEETYSVSQRFDVSGKRGKKVEAALKSREARVLFLDHDVATLLVQMRQTFFRILLLKANEKALADIAVTFSAVEDKTNARVMAGDVSEADLMKLSAEKRKILRSLESLRANLRVETKNLALLLNMHESDPEVTGEFKYRAVSLDLQALRELGLKNRPDLKGQDAAVIASAASLAASKKEALPSFSVEAGYKRRTAGFKGFVFGVSVPLPLFDRNQAGVARAQTELQKEKIALEIAKNTAVYEVNLLFERITSLQAKINDMARQLDTESELTKIAGIAYEKGETGLLDLLDAVRSQKELAMEYNSAVYEHWAVLSELEKTTGMKLTQIGGTK